MKSKTTQLIKFKKLQRRLGLTKKRDVVGLLESLWHLTLREAPQGDIGKLDNESIAIELEWDDDPDLLIQALVDTTWLDACEQHRLVVHDWRDHAPDYIKGNLSKHGRSFATAICSEQPAIANCPEHAIPDLTCPSLPSSVFRLPSSEALPEEIKNQIPAKWHETTAEPLKFSDADGTENSVFETISRPETLSDPLAIHNWWRYQLGCPSPVFGDQAAWCVIALALGLRFSNHKTQRWKSRVGVWSNAVQKGWFSQAGPFIPKAIELLEPILFPKDQTHGETPRHCAAAAAREAASAAV